MKKSQASVTPCSPVNEGPLGVHEVELVIQPGPGLGDGRGVAQHADGALNLSQVTARDHGRRLVVDTDLKMSRNSTYQSKNV